LPPLWYTLLSVTVGSFVSAWIFRAKIVSKAISSVIGANVNIAAIHYKPHTLPNVTWHIENITLHPLNNTLDYTLNNNNAALSIPLVTLSSLSLSNPSQVSVYSPHATLEFENLALTESNWTRLYRSALKSNAVLNESRLMAERRAQNIALPRVSVVGECSLRICSAVLSDDGDLIEKIVVDGTRVSEMVENVVKRNGLAMESSDGGLSVVEVVGNVVEMIGGMELKKRANSVPKSMQSAVIGYGKRVVGYKTKGEREWGRSVVDRAEKEWNTVDQLGRKVVGEQHEEWKSVVDYGKELLSTMRDALK